MQREQNAISYVLFFLIIMSSNNIYSQEKLEGKYTNLAPLQEYYNYYIFYGNGIFDYHSGASLGDDKYGKGYYQIKKDSLILSYDLTALTYKSYHKAKEYYNSKDITTLKVVVKNFNNTVITHSNLYIQGNKMGHILGHEGFVNFELKKENKDFFLKVSNLEYESYTLKLSKMKNYEIEIFLKKAATSSKAIKNEIETYQIIEHSKAYIKLKNKNQLLKLVKQTP